MTSYIPARMEEGYGLNETAIRALAAENVGLIVTVDCGITASEEAALCRELGVSLVITDHHECKNELPEAEAVVDPHRRDQPEPRAELAGVGVAFKLAAAISGDQAALLEEYCDLLCLGTVADVMPLTGENRTMRVSEMNARSVGGGKAIITLSFPVHNLSELTTVSNRLHGISGVTAVHRGTE